MYKIYSTFVSGCKTRLSFEPYRQADFKNIYSPALKRGGGLYRIWVVCHSVHLFVGSFVCSFVCHNFFVSAQYLQNAFIEFIKILYVH